VIVLVPKINTKIYIIQKVSNQNEKTERERRRELKIFPCGENKTYIYFHDKKNPTVVELGIALNTERSYKRQGHAPLKHFVGFPVQWWKARITVA